MMSGVRVMKSNDRCYFCNAPAIGVHHLIFGTANRKLCDADGLYIAICANCHTSGPIPSRIHDNPMAEKLSKMLGQALWEIKETGCDEEELKTKFRKRYGGNYL